MVKEASVVPTETDVHRAAAWWAGEGSVSWRSRKLQISVAQKERNVCDWLQERFGGSVRATKESPGRCQMHYWYACGDSARLFIRRIVDLLPESPRRQAQLLEALEATAGRLKRGPKPSLVCAAGHAKGREGGRCSVCAEQWRRAYRATPIGRLVHNETERARYQLKKEARHAQ